MILLYNYFNIIIGLILVFNVFLEVNGLQALRKSNDYPKDFGTKRAQKGTETHTSDAELKAILEQKYKFKADENSTRFREMPRNDVFNVFLEVNGLQALRKSNDYPKDFGTKRAQKGTETHTSDAELKAILEQKYKFKADENSTRFREMPRNDEEKSEWEFRAYAVRRIVGGMETSISLYPYNVAISKNGNHWCGGSIIDEQWVLTAGHCMEPAFDGDKQKLKIFIVRAGSSFHTRGGYQARVNKVFFPRAYSPGNADYDYSLARLDRPMPIGRNIAVLNLPSKDYRTRNGDVLIISGWGSTHDSGYGNIPERLRFVPIPVMDLKKCQKSYNFLITPRMLCAGYATGGKDACNHDSGGPAVRDGVLIGVVSFGGKKCADPDSPGVYAKVSVITDWVQKTINNNEAYNVPELRAKIDKARKRERDLRKIKSRVEDKKGMIKLWLRNTLKSPTFINHAKKKLREADLQLRRTFEVPLVRNSSLDETNLINSINERIIEDGAENDDVEKLLRTLALQQLILQNNGEYSDDDLPVNTTMEAVIAVVRARAQ